MLVFDNHNEPLILDNIYTPTLTDHIWVLDMQIMDYTLAQLLVLEEIVAPTIVLSILGFEFPLPSTWNILIVDQETQQLDVVEIGQIAGKEFRAFLYGPNKARFESATIRMVDYKAEYHNIGPSLFKHQMLCHPVAQDLWVNVSPSDGYGKYLKDKIAGDIV